MSNDVWCFERSDLQPRKAMKMVLKHCKAIVKSKSADEVFLRLEDNGGVMRLDKTALPKKWKCPTVSREEIDAIKPLEHKIRLGRVSKIDKAGIHFAKETLAYPENALFVNCIADALAPRDPKPVFSKGHIELQSIFFCQQVFSSAAIGRLERAPLTDGMRNWVKSVPHPKTPEDWPSVLSRTIDNALKLHVFMPLWMIRSRLFYLSHEPIWDYLVYATKAFLVSSPLRRAARRLDALR